MKSRSLKANPLCAATLLCLGAGGTLLLPLTAQAQAAQPPASQPAPSPASQPAPSQASKPALTPEQARSLITSLIVLGHQPQPVTPEQQARRDREDLLVYSAARALHAGQYAQAEADARQDLALGDISGATREILAGALDGQGRTQEALQEYGRIVSKGATVPRTLLPYALLLLKTGQWAQAVAAYDQALPTAQQLKGVQIKDGLWLLRAGTQFSADAPDPVGLATAIHIGLGIIYDSSADSAHESQDEQALTEYKQALALMPDWALANYFYGYGLGELGLRQQSVAAYQKASDLATGDVKTAADRALKK